MKYFFILICFLFSASIIAEEIDKNFEKTIKNINIITDKQFKNDLLKYMYYDSRLDYINRYKYLSKEFLKKHFPEIKNAEEYKNHFNNSERGEPTYIEIINYNQLSKKEYAVQIAVQEEGEGSILYNIEEYHFLNENEIWKYKIRSLIKSTDITNSNSIYLHNSIFAKIISEDGLRMRKGPSINTAKIVLIPYQEKVMVHEILRNDETINNKNGKWVKVKWREYSGWVFDAYLEYP